MMHGRKNIKLRYWAFLFRKMRGTSWLAKDVLAPQEDSSVMFLVSLASNFSCFVVCFIRWLVNWLVGTLVVWFAFVSVGLVGWFAGWLVGLVGFVDWSASLVGWFGWMVDFVGCLASCLVCLVGWVIGRSVSLLVWTHGRVCPILMTNVNKSFACFIQSVQSDTAHMVVA